MRGHSLAADQPLDAGGEDTAHTPTELFIASYAGCVAFYAERFLRRHGLGTEGLRVSCGYTWAQEPARVGTIAIRVTAPGLRADQQEAFRRVVDRCPIGNTLRLPPAVELEVDPVPAAV